MSVGKFLFTSLILFSFIIPDNNLAAQITKENQSVGDTVWKNMLSPGLLKKRIAFLKSDNPLFFTVEIRDTARFLSFTSAYKSGVNILRRYGRHFFVIRCSPALFQQLIQEDLIMQADEAILMPLHEGGVISFDHTVNAIEAAHHFFPSLNGTGQLVSVKENRMDTADIDLAGRYRNTGVAAQSGNTHATVMTTLIAGAGNSSYKGRGVAFKSKYTSSDFTGVLPDSDEIYRNEDIRVQNHSYGAALQSWYGTHARAFDLSVNINPALLHVFSSGNSGMVTPADGSYSGIKGYANLTGNMKMAKNILVVGAIDSALQIPAASSRGPAYDGRLKPDIVAFAEDGTSGSAALVSGASLLLQQYYEEKNSIHAGSELIKSVLINSADDVGSPGPDFISGYGNMNLNKALLTISDNRIISGNLLPFSMDEHVIFIPEGAMNFKLTLCWNDPANVAFVSKALMNDLDLSVEKVSTGEIWLPWVLNSAAHPDSLALPATRKKDSLNNTEQVGIDAAGGQYKITIRSTILRNVTQAYSLAWQFDIPDTFMWMAPLSSSKLQAGNNYMLRWHQVFPAGTRGDIHWRKSNQQVWDIIGNQVLLEENKFSWLVPNEFTTGELRMIVGNDTVYSGEFTINPLPKVNAGWICDSILIYWSPAFAENRWNVYRLAHDSLQWIGEVQDTSMIISGNGSPYLAVAPVIEGKPGLRSETINSDQQGVGCYINSFLADLVNENKGRISLQLGTVYGIQKIRILKTGSEIKELALYSSGFTNTYVYTDNDLRQGINSYVAEIEIGGGITIRSGVEVIYYNNDKPYVLFPNPVRRGEPIRILQEQVNDLECILYDAAGRLIRKYSGTDKVAVIPTSDLVAGWYYLVIYDEMNRAYRYKIIVR